MCSVAKHTSIFLQGGGLMCKYLTCFYSAANESKQTAVRLMLSMRVLEIEDVIMEARAALLLYLFYKRRLCFQPNYIKVASGNCPPQLERITAQCVEVSSLS